MNYSGLPSGEAVPCCQRSVTRSDPAFNPRGLKGKIKSALKEILQDPSCGKPLSEELSGLHSYRIGRIRIIYRVEGRLVSLLTIGPRSTIYQKVALEIKPPSPQ